MADLPDVNVWIAMSVPDHVHRARAERYWREEAAEQVAFCTTTMLGLVRVCSNAHLFADSALSPSDAWAIFTSWVALPEIRYLVEPVGCRQQLDEHLSSGVITPRTWTDAYLASFAATAGLRLVSFDGDFRRYSGLDFLHLVP